MLVVKREKAPVAILNRFKVILDGEVIGDLKYGETKSFELTEGTHTLQINLDWSPSNVESFVFKKGETIYANCSFTSNLLVHTLHALDTKYQHIKLTVSKTGEKSAEHSSTKAKK